ncbi:methyltransferase family protein [Zunongwangia profunda]|uniref:methyltransferase family protein n=1 Tax=Zunongwangia profunda TaxID=398743 RepID=UPI001D188C9B|nr:isoprenylcysteine carboxylmethyltransferase family protein [Zunongwangia profunda]MCC4229035.1 isoprenylcysteine carboxylmethyltransferase family protein [Zunongwangia profunda]
MKINKLSYQDYLFVALQFLIFATYFLPFKIVSIDIPEWLRYLGLVVIGLALILGTTALLQLNTKISPFPTPVSNGKLIRTGAFKVSRHPIYTALIFSAMGYTIYQESLLKLLITLVLLILFYFKSGYEEKLLGQTFSEYEDYKKKTRRFI